MEQFLEKSVICYAFINHSPLQPHPIIHNCGIHIRDHKTQHMNYKIGMTTSPMIRQCGVPCSQKECSSWWPALLVLPSLASIGPASCNLCALDTDVTWTPSPVTITSICKILKIYYKWRVRLVHDHRLMFWSCHPSVDAQLVSSPATPWLLNFSEKQPKDRMSPEPQLTGLAKTFNSVTFTGRANVAKATYASKSACRIDCPSTQLYASSSSPQYLN